MSYQHDPLQLRDAQQLREDPCQSPADDWRDLLTDDAPPMSAADERRFWIRIALEIAERREREAGE